MQLNKGKKRKYIRVNAGTQVEEGDTEGRNCEIRVIKPIEDDVMMKNIAVETMKHNLNKENNIDKGDLKEEPESDSKEEIDINKVIKEHSDIIDEDSSEVSIKEEEEDNSSTEIKEEELPVIEEPREKIDPKEMKTSILSFIES